MTGSVRRLLSRNQVGESPEAGKAGQRGGRRGPDQHSLCQGLGPPGPAPGPSHTLLPPGARAQACPAGRLMGPHPGPGSGWDSGGRLDTRQDCNSAAGPCPEQEPVSGGTLPGTGAGLGEHLAPNRSRFGGAFSVLQRGTRCLRQLTLRVTGWVRMLPRTPRLEWPQWDSEGGRRAHRKVWTQAPPEAVQSTGAAPPHGSPRLALLRPAGLSPAWPSCPRSRPRSAPCSVGLLPRWWPEAAGIVGAGEGVRGGEGCGDSGSG